MVPTPFLRTFQIRINCFPNMLHSNHPQIVFDWSSRMFSLLFLSLVNTPSRPSDNLPQKGVQGRYISQSLVLWFTWLKVWLGTEFFIQNHFLSEFGKGGPDSAAAKFKCQSFSLTLLVFTWGLIHLGCNTLVEEWGTGLIISGSSNLHQLPTNPYPFTSHFSPLHLLALLL